LAIYILIFGDRDDPSKKYYPSLLYVCTTLKNVLKLTFNNLNWEKSNAEKKLVFLLDKWSLAFFEET
jgi:hypothetical protein